MNKKVSIKSKPTPTAADAWVQDRSKPEPMRSMKRLTLDIDEDLHRAMKRKAADEGRSMVEDIREILRQAYM